MILVARRMAASPRQRAPGTDADRRRGLLRPDPDDHPGKPADRDGRKWFPFLATLFLFIWFSNMIGYMPLPTNTEHKVDIFGLAIPSFALYAATANISVPLALTLIVICSYHFEGIRAKGVTRYLKSWVPAGVEGRGALPDLPDRGDLALRAHRLALRSTFANILAGHLLILFMGGGLVVLLNLAVFGSVCLGLLTGVDGDRLLRLRGGPGSHPPGLHLRDPYRDLPRRRSRRRALKEHLKWTCTSSPR